MEAWHRGGVAEAVLYLDRYRELRPDDPLAVILRAVIYTQLHRFEDARELLAGCVDEVSKDERSQRSWMRRWAGLLERQGEFGEAERHRRLILERDPSDTMDWIRLGDCLSAQGRLVEAREAYRNGTDCEHDREAAWLEVGVIARALGELDEARHAATRALAINPEDRAAERLLADVQSALDWSEGGKLDFMSADTVWELMWDAHDREGFGEALVLLERYRLLCPGDPFAEASAATIYTDLRRFEAAETWLAACADTLMTTRGGEGVWTRKRADLLHARRQFAEEEHRRRRLIELGPAHSMDWIFLGVCLSAQGRLIEARDAYLRGTQCEGDPDEAWLNVGYIARALGELEDAREAASRALAICPRYPEAETLLADVTAALALRAGGSALG